MAYAVKPAVVRVNAVSTARFRYSPNDIASAAKVLGATPHDVPKELVVDTGAGGSGSGFVIHPDGYVLTSAHVIAPTRSANSLEPELRKNGAAAALVRHFDAALLRSVHARGELEPVVAKLASAGSLANVVTSNRIDLSNGESHPYVIVHYSDPTPNNGDDLALLRVLRTNLPTLPLADSDDVHIQEQIWAVGYPAVASSGDEVIGGWLSAESDLEATFNPGTITAIKRNVAEKPIFQSNVAIYSGNSGGPAVNREGAVIGISMWGHTSAEQIKFLLPINTARPLLAAAKVPHNVEGKFNVAYRGALRSAARGEWKNAKEQLAVAERLFPNSPDLMRFTHEADVALKNAMPWSSIPPSKAALGGISLALVVSVIFTLRRRRPRVILPPVVHEVVVRPDLRNDGSHPTLLPSEGGSLLGKLTVLNGERAGERYGLGGSGIRIGREAGVCEIVLDNPRVSRLHAEVVSLDGRVLLIDRNSSNGTYVNDQKVERRFLRDGDIIYFGGRNAIAVAFHTVSA